MRRFIGFTSYYRRFVPSFAQKAAPLHALVGQLVEKKKGKKVKVGDLWKDEHDIAFSALKEALTSTHVLCYPDFSKGFILEIDASAAGLGAILSQEQKGQRIVVAYASRGLCPNERKSDTFSSMQLETLALVWAVGDKFKDYLHRPFTVITDNNPLSYFMSKEKLSAKEQKWAAMLARYEFTIEYRSGRKNVAADALSRQERRPWDTSGSSLSETCALLVGTTKVSPELQAHILDGVQRPVVVECNKLNIALDFHQNAMCLPTITLDGLAELQDRDPVLGIIRKCITQATKLPRIDQLENLKELKMLYRQRKILFVKEDILYRKVQDPKMGNLKQIVVPQVLKSKMLESCHDQHGHSGLERTLAVLRSRCYWYSMESDVKRHIDNCVRCVLSKPVKVTTPLGNILASKPLEVLAIDFTLMDKATDGRENVLVLTDSFTK